MNHVKGITAKNIKSKYSTERVSGRVDTDVRCEDCKYYKPHYTRIIAPLGPITADGLCKNENNKSQPIIENSKKDYCKYAERT